MPKTFDKLQASLLYCARCTRAMPVRERLLLVLPAGDLYDYLCQGCGSSVGSKTESSSLYDRRPLMPPHPGPLP